MSDKMPRTAGEWQEAVDLARGAMLLDAAKAYGLVTGGPVINVERCRLMLQEGQRRGFKPSADAAEKFLQSIL